MKKRLFFLAACLFLFFSGIAQIPPGYYSQATDKTGEELRSALRNITSSGHVMLPYTDVVFDVWDAYAFTDVRPAPDNTIIWDMYSDIPGGTPAYFFTLFTSQCGNAAAEGDCYSREHLMPNSWWGGLNDSENPQYTDLHHLFPADQYVNLKKSNYIVAETSSPNWISTNGSKVGPCSYPGYTGIVFEPINAYKGDFARAFLYLAARYMDNLSEWLLSYPTTNAQYVINSTGGNYKQWYIDMLISWHFSDPVSEKEIDRNNNIYYNTPQNNRNPFVDHPEFVCLVWDCPTSPVITNIIQTPAFPNSASTVTITANITDNDFVANALLEWCTDGISFDQSMVMDLNEAPNYISTSPIPGHPAGTTVTYRIRAADNEENWTTSVSSNYRVIKDEPVDYPGSFTCGTTTSTAISLSWTDASGSVAPDGYLIKTSSTSLEAITDPIDGQSEANGAFVKNVSQGVQSITFTGLVPSTNYYFKIYPYTNFSSTIDYKTTTPAPGTSCFTLARTGGDCAVDLVITEYVEGSSNNKYIEISNNTGSDINLSDYSLQLYSNGSLTPTSVLLEGTLVNQSSIVYRNSGALVYSGEAIINAAVNFNGDDAMALFKLSTGSFVDIFGRIGEDPGSAWTSGSYSTVNKTLVRNASVNAGVTSNPVSGFPTLATEWTQYNTDEVSYLGAHTILCPTCAYPVLQASNISSAPLDLNSYTLSWTNGDGENRLVVMRQGEPVSEIPAEGISYTANTVFGSGDQVAPGEYVVYNGNGSSVTVNNLAEGQVYHISVFEYNCSPGSQLYLSPPVSATVSTYSLAVGYITGNQFCITETTGFTTSIDFSSAGIFTENTYTAQLSDAMGYFVFPTNIGFLETNANEGTISCHIPANTGSGTGYRIRVVSSNPSLAGSVSNPFEIILYRPAEAPLSAYSSRAEVCENDGGTMDLSVSGGSGDQLSWFTLGCGETSIGTGNPLNIGVPAETTSYYARWENSCSVSSCAVITVYVSADILPGNAGTISGPVSVCQEENAVSYSVPKIENASSYQWTLPEGASGLASTNSIEVNFGSSTVSGDISVKGINGCGQGESSSIAVTVNAKPQTPVVSKEGSILRSNAAEGNQWYNSSGLIENAINQEYIAEINDTYYTIVTLNGCSSDPSNSIGVETGFGFTGNRQLVKIYPNPVPDQFTIEVKGSTNRIYFEIFTLSGQIVYEDSFVEETTLWVADFKPGVYIIKFRHEQGVERKLFVKK